MCQVLYIHKGVQGTKVSETQSCPQRTHTLEGGRVRRCECTGCCKLYKSFERIVHVVQWSLLGTVKTVSKEVEE